MSDYISEVRLLHVPLENDYKHTLFFLDRESQTNYFLSKTVKTQTECYYQRKDNIIKFDACVDDLLVANYVMYKNKAHSNKWYYAFITDMVYRNDAMTEISIETDVMQTWLRDYDYTIKPSFIEREHVASDIIGEHTFPEQLETGDYIVNDANKNGSLLANSLIMATTVDLNDYDDALIGAGKYKAVAGARYAGIYSGLKYYQVITNTKLTKGVIRYVQ